MKFTQSQIKYLNQNKAVIKKGDFDSFFKNLPENDRSIFARFFYANGIDILDKMRIIPDKLFYGCDIIIGATIGQGCIEIGENAFANCQNLKAVTMPDSVKRLGDSAFENCPNLQQIKLSNKIETIPIKCFSGDSNLGEVVLPPSVEILKPLSFAGCDNLILRVDNIQNLSFKASEKEFFKQHIRKMKKQESLHKSTLKEAFDPSFPQWLKDDLVDKNAGGNKVKNQLLNRGIDLNKAKFIPQNSLPQKRNDPILKNENLLAVFELQIPDRYGNTGHKTLYIRGIEDSRSPWNPRKGEYVEFTYWPLKDVVDYTTNWGYLDTTDATVTDYRQLRSDRQQMKRDRLNSEPLRYSTTEEGPYADYVAMDDKKIGGGWRSKFDKSGYKIVKPEEKYKDALAKLRQSKAGSKLDKVYSNLKYIQRIGKNAISDLDFLGDDSSSNQSIEIVTILNDLRRKIKTYNQILQCIQYWDANPNERYAYVDGDYFRQDDMFSNGGTLARLEDDTNQLKKRLDKYEDSFIDWEVEESLKKNNMFTINEKLFEDIENLEDVDIITNPVMQDAKDQSEWASKEIEKEMKDIEKDIPEWDSEKVIGASKQPVPDKIKEPKMELDESLFTEARFMGYTYPFEAHWMRPNGNDVLLGADKSLKGADRIIQDQVEELMNNPFESDKDKLLILQNVYIYNSDTDEVEDVSDETDTFIQRCIQSLYD